MLSVVVMLADALSLLTVIVMSGLPVATVAEAMLYNAITVFSSATAPDPPVTVANNTLIRQWASEVLTQYGMHASASNIALVTGNQASW